MMVFCCIFATNLMGHYVVLKQSKLQTLNIHNINEDLTQTNKYVFFSITQ